ncbi:MAG: hypothetical protein U0W24_14540 [Bacteroidales bacterium]
MSVLKGIGIGIGFIFGLIVGILLIVLFVWVCLHIIKLFMRRSFTLELFKQYQKELLKKERFEELSEVNIIIEKLRKNETPREILKNYTVKVESYFYWMPDGDGGERLTYKFDKKIKRFKNKKPIN